MEFYLETFFQLFLSVFLRLTSDITPLIMHKEILRSQIRFRDKRAGTSAASSKMKEELSLSPG